MVKTFTQWLVLSSKDPTKYSLFIKGALTMMIGVLITFLPMVNVDISGLDTTSIVNQVVALFETMLKAVDGIIQAIGYVMMVYGGIRKIWLTLNGENHPTLE